MHVSLQCIIGDGEAVVGTVIRVPEMIQRIIDHNEKTGAGEASHLLTSRRMTTSL